MFRATIYGNLTADAQISQYNAQCCNFTVAVRTSAKDKETNQPVTNFIRVSVWGKLAETCAASLKKGNPVICSGNICVDSYADRNGTTRYNINMNYADVQFVSTRAANQPVSANGASPSEDDELPF